MNIVQVTRGSRLRVLVVVVAVATVVTGGASAVPNEGHGPAASLAGRCSKATALAVASGFGVVTDSTLPNPIAKVLCGSFTGLGSEALVVQIRRCRVAGRLQAQRGAQGIAGRAAVGLFER